MAFGNNKGKGKQYHLSFNIEAVGKKIKWGREEGNENSGFKDFKKRTRKNIKL